MPMSDRLDKARQFIKDELASGALRPTVLTQAVAELESAARAEGWEEAMEVAAWHLEVGLLNFPGTVCAAALRSLAKDGPK